MAVTEEDFKDGALVYYDEYGEILTGFIFYEDSLWKCYWLESKRVVPNTESWFGTFTLDNWLRDPRVEKIETPFETKTELGLFTMCNPGHDDFLRRIYPHFYKEEK